MIIKPVNGRWTINDKTLAEITPAEYELLNQFFLEAKKEFQSKKIDEKKVTKTEPLKIKQI